MPNHVTCTHCNGGNRNVDYGAGGCFNCYGTGHRYECSRCGADFDAYYEAQACEARHATVDTGVPMSDAVRAVEEVC